MLRHSNRQIRWKNEANPFSFRCIAFISFVLLIVLIAIPLVWTWRLVRREQLNRELIEAIKRNDAQGVVALLQQGADANTEEKAFDPHNPLWEEFLDKILHRPPPPVAAGPAALILTLTTGTEHHSPQRIAVFKALLNHGANPNVYFYADCVLALAVQANLLDQVHLLIQHGADVRRVPQRIVIETAVEKDDPAIIADLVDHGIEMNPYGCSLLSYAVEDDRPEIVRILLDRHIDVNKGIGELTPLKEAETRATPKIHRIVKMLQQAGAKE